MKLFEDMKDLGSSIHEVVKQLINDIYKDDVDDDVLDKIVDNLSLSDILDLDTAYSSGDHNEIRSVLDPLLKLDEYSMGQGRTATSAASNRPEPGKGQAQQAPKKSGTTNTTQTNRNYSGGVQNGVTTNNIDSEDDPEAVEEPIEESNTITPKQVKQIMNKKGFYHSGDTNEKGWIEYSNNAGDAYWMSWPDGAWKNTNGQSGRFDDGSLVASFETNFSETKDWLQRRAGIK